MVGGDAVALGGETEHQPMPQHRPRDGANVLGGHVHPPVEQGMGLRPQQQALARPRARPPGQILVDEVGGVGRAGAGRPHQLHGISRAAADNHLAHDPLQGENRRPVQHRLQRLRVGRGRSLGDRQLFVETRIIDDDLEHETVQLGLGQRIGPFLLDRVLRAQDEKRLFQNVVLAGDGDAVFLHRLQQGRLRLRRRAVDLVAEDDVPENGAFDKPHPSPPALLSSRISVPVMSEGIKSGVN